MRTGVAIVRPAPVRMHANDNLEPLAGIPNCAVRRDGRCALAGSDYCARLCPHANGEFTS